MDVMTDARVCNVQRVRLTALCAGCIMRSLELQVFLSLNELNNDDRLRAAELSAFSHITHSSKFSHSDT